MSIEARFSIQKENFSLTVELDIPEKGITSLFGPTGCGKTTIMRAIAGLDRHKDAYLKVGKQIWQDHKTFVAVHKRSLGYVFQEANLFTHLDVFQNIQYGFCRLSKANQKIQLEYIVELLNLSKLLKQKPETLSGGEKQRVAIARALAVSPGLLLMDEPLASLDQKSKEEILPYIESLHKELNIPVIYISHSREEITRLTDYLILIENGRIIATGNPNLLFTRLDLPLSNKHDATSIIESMVVGHDKKHNLSHLKFPGGELVVNKPLLPIGKKIKIWFYAHDVSITLEKQKNTSILNILKVTIDDITEDQNNNVNIRLLSGSVPILSRITKKSAMDLKLEPGKIVFAQIKSVALFA